MRKIAFLLLALVLLIRCGGSHHTSLPHALAALRAGDYNDFLEAKRENDAEVTGAIQPGSDLCLAGGADFFKYGVQYALSQIDRKALFELAEEERLLLALKIAADDPHLPPGHFLEQAPIMRMVGNGEKAPGQCNRERENMVKALLFDSGYIGKTNEGRFDVLQAWIDDLKSRSGAGLDARMNAARAHLDAMGYSTKWPVGIR